MIEISISLEKKSLKMKELQSMLVIKLIEITQNDHVMEDMSARYISC